MQLEGTNLLVQSNTFTWKVTPYEYQPWVALQVTIQNHSRSVNWPLISIGKSQSLSLISSIVSVAKFFCSSTKLPTFSSNSLSTCSGGIITGSPCNSSLSSEPKVVPAELVNSNFRLNCFIMFKRNDACPVLLTRAAKPRPIAQSKMVPPHGLEPRTYWLQISNHSIYLTVISILFYTLPPLK